MISNFTKYIQEFDSLTKDLLNCTNVYLTEDDAVWFFTLSKWKFRLKQQGKLILFSNKNKIYIAMMTLLKNDFRKGKHNRFHFFFLCVKGHANKKKT